MTNKKEEEKKVEKKKEVMTLTAVYKQRNIDDGTVEKVTHKGTGATLADAVADMKDYPKGLACNILITLERNGKEYTKNVAPVKARAILENADEYVLESLYRGI